MRLFLSYASEDDSVASGIAAALSASGHKVFFDRTSLFAGVEFHATIARELENCDVFVLLLSEFTFARKRYVANELELAMRRWPDPSGHVLPVLLSPFDEAKIPGYLRAVTMLRPTADIPASVVGAILQLGAMNHSSRPQYTTLRTVVAWALLSCLAAVALSSGLVIFDPIALGAFSVGSGLIAGWITYSRLRARRAAKNEAIAGGIVVGSGVAAIASAGAKVVENTPLLKGATKGASGLGQSAAGSNSLAAAPTVAGTAVFAVVSSGIILVASSVAPRHGSEDRGLELAPPIILISTTQPSPDSSMPISNGPLPIESSAHPVIMHLTPPDPSAGSSPIPRPETGPSLRSPTGGP